jgi:hypothetical protein
MGSGSVYFFEVIQLNETGAMIFFGAIMAIALIVWLISLYYTLRIGMRYDANEWREKGLSTFGLVGGQIVCEASKEELLQRIPKVMRRQSLGILNTTFSVDEKSDQELSLVRLGPRMCNLPTCLYFSNVRFRFQVQSPTQTLVLYSVEQSEVMRILKKISLNILAWVGLPLMAIVGYVMWFWVIPNPTPAIRYQVFQTFQVCHALWPPFMFIGIAAAAQRAPTQFVERILMIASDQELANEVTPMNLIYGGLPIHGGIQ